MKKFMALALTAALSLTSAAVVFADEYDYDYECEYDCECEYEEEYEEYEEYVEEVVEVVEVVNVPFTGTSRLVTGGWGTILGNIPVFPGNASLNQRIEALLSVTYYRFLQVDAVSRPRPAGMDVFSFTLEETLTAARVEIFFLTDDLVKSSIFTVYVDKANNAEITPAAFAESAELAEAVAVVDEEYDEDDAVQGEVEVIVEAVMRPIRINAEAAGFTVNWYYDGAVVVYDETLVLNLLTGSVLATLTGTDEEMVSITLDAAPINVSGVVYVPSTLLTDVLGIQFTLLTSADAVAPAVEVVEEEVVEAEEYEYEEYEYEEYEYEVEEYEYEVVELTFADLVAAVEAGLIAELLIYEDESLELTIVEGYELVLILHSDDAYLVEDFEAYGLEFAEDLLEEFGVEYLILTVRIIAIDGVTVLFEETFEV